MQTRAMSFSGCDCSSEQDKVVYVDKVVEVEKEKIIEKVKEVPVYIGKRERDYTHASAIAHATPPRHH